MPARLGMWVVAAGMRERGRGGQMQKEHPHGALTGH